MKKLTKSLPHVLVEVNGVCVLHELPDHLALVVLHHQHLLWFGHAAHHQQTYLQEEGEEGEEEEDGRERLQQPLSEPAIQPS